MSTTQATYECTRCSLTWDDCDVTVTWECPTCWRILHEKDNTRITLTKDEIEFRKAVRFFFGPRFHTGLRPSSRGKT